MNNRELYSLAVRSAHELLVNSRNTPRTKEDKVCVIATLERILFKRNTVPSEFQEVSDLYIRRGVSSLYD